MSVSRSVSEFEMLDQHKINQYSVEIFSNPQEEYCESLRAISKEIESVYDVVGETSKDAYGRREISLSLT